MKKLLVLAIMLALVTGTAMANPNGYLLNDYFGVQDLGVGSNGYFNNSWDASVGQSVVEDWPTNSNAPDPGPAYYISEAFDIEAMYLDINTTDEMVYFSVVTSMPNTGFKHTPWYGNYLFRTGDLRFNIGDDMFVLGTMDRSYKGNNYYGNLYNNPNMAYYDGYRGFASRGNPLLDTLTTSGDGLDKSSNFEFSYEEYLDANGNSIVENGYSTYIMEGAIAFSDFAGANVAAEGITMDLAMSCNNDNLSLTAASPVPEPGTITLLGLGLIGLYAGRRRFRK